MTTNTTNISARADSEPTAATDKPLPDCLKPERFGQKRGKRVSKVLQAELAKVAKKIAGKP